MKDEDSDQDSILIARLFDAHPVIVEGQRMGTDPPPIHPEEAAQVEAAVPRRQVEFAIGRSCARNALARLGIRDFVLRSEPGSRAPRWPPGVVGSITHTGAVPGGYCGVVVASAREVLTVGLDAEVGEFLSRDLWCKILTQKESEWLLGFPSSLQPQKARLAFSAKECFYKAQFPLTRHFLGFKDVEVSVDPTSSTFDVRVVRGASVDGALGYCVGRYAECTGMVVTGIAVGAAGVA